MTGAPSDTQADFHNLGVFVLGVEIAADFSKHTPEQIEKMAKLLERVFVNDWRTGA